MLSIFGAQTQILPPHLWGFARRCFGRFTQERSTLSLESGPSSNFPASFGPPTFFWGSEKNGETPPKQISVSEYKAQWPQFAATHLQLENLEFFSHNLDHKIWMEDNGLCHVHWQRQIKLFCWRRAIFVCP